MPRKKTPPPYAVHPSVAYAQTVIGNLAEKTGHSIDEWVRLIARDGPSGERDRRAWLKAEHGLGGTTAMLIVERSLGKGGERTDAAVYLRVAGKYVESMYRGKKEHLRPIHDALIHLGRALGPDVRVSPCKTIVPLYREHVFAEIKPATQKRVDLGLALKKYGKKAPARVVETGGLAKGDRITHRIPISSPGEVDADVERWLKVAYDLDA